MECCEVAKGRLDNWSVDACIQKREAGQFVDLAGVHTLNHKGEFFGVRGPLNVSLPIQGYPVMFTAGQSEAGREMGAKLTDCQFTVAMTKEEAVKLYDDIKSRMPKYGRIPDIDRKSVV